MLVIFTGSLLWLQMSCLTSSLWVYDQAKDKGSSMLDIHELKSISEVRFAFLNLTDFPSYYTKKTTELPPKMNSELNE
jgi:hypothetical protein